MAATLKDKVIKVRVEFHNTPNLSAITFNFLYGCFDVKVENGMFTIIDYKPIDKDVIKGTVMVGSLSNCTILYQIEP